MDSKRLHSNVKPTPLVATAQSGLLQRTCACGQHTGTGGECEACRKQRQATLQRATISAPPISIATSTSIEPRFGHDFSQIPSYRNVVGTLQTKLAINKPGDEYEQEADRIADQVIAASAYTEVAAASPHIQRYAGQPNGQVETAPASVDHVLASAGRPLEPALRQHMEQRFGYDFSHVRLHTGDAAEQSANDVSALAYTVGHNIVFGADQFAPETHAGQRLIAHELTHVVQQGKNDLRMLSRACDVDSALDYYKKTPQGKKIDFHEWLEKMGKVAGTANKSLYDAAKADGKIGRSFVILACKIQELLNIRQDGKLGTAAAVAFDKFTTGGKKGIDYTKLFKDKKLEIGIAIGDEFQSEFTAIVTLLENAGKKLKNFSSTGSTGTKLIKFTKNFPVQGDNTAAPVEIDVEFNIISSASAAPKKAYTEFLSQKEIVIYSGHARYGTGPDFDEKKSVKENFIIGVNSALHKAGKLTKGYDAHMNKILEGYGNDLEAMSKSGKIDPDKYQVWFFNACSSINYLDEVRKGLATDKSGKPKSRTNLRFVGTKESIYSDAVKIVEAILNMKTIDQIIDIMNVNEKAEVKKHGEKPKDSYYFSD